ncbi:integrase core domain-containing protein, partial [Rhizobiaceae sp. 2RAB30]
MGGPATSLTPVTERVGDYARAGPRRPAHPHQGSGCGRTSSPGEVLQNGFCESFKVRMRDAFLSAPHFASLAYA